jgi:hypothetical protein
MPIIRVVQKQLRTQMNTNNFLLTIIYHMYNKRQDFINHLRPILLPLVIVFVIIFVFVFLYPSRIPTHTPPRLEDCYLKLVYIFNQIDTVKRETGELPTIDSINNMLKINEPRRCHYIWVGEKETFNGIPILVKCCEHEPFYIINRQKESNKCCEKGCNLLLSNGKVDFL